MRAPWVGSISWSAWLIAALFASLPLRAEDALLTADFSVQSGVIRPLHGVNKGPLAPGGIFDVIREHPHCFPGADYDTLAKEDATEKVHLSEPGARKAARLWAAALDSNFFRTAKPLSAK